MRARLPWILLTISLTLNIFFLVGVGYSKYWAGRGDADQRLEAVAERLSLSQEQQAGLAALQEQVQRNHQAMSRGKEDLRAALLAETGKPAFDPKRVTTLIEEQGEERTTFFVGLAAGLHDYLATLSPEQKRQFLELAEEPGFLRGLLIGPRRDDG